MKYNPYEYPPNYQLAMTHSKCTEPGDLDPDGIICPCCNQQQKTPITSWFWRSLDIDFRKYGGAITTYFSLLKYYAIVVFLVLSVYSWYQIKCIEQNCLKDGQSPELEQLCVKTFGIYFVSTKELLSLMRKFNDSRISIILVCRGVVFGILILANLISLVLVGRKVRKSKQKQLNIEDFTLLFKSINKTWQENDLIEQIHKIDPKIQIKEIFFLHKTDQYKKWSDLKIAHYFKLKETKEPKEVTKLRELLERATDKTNKLQLSLIDGTGRAVVTFNQFSDKLDVLEHFKATRLQRFKSLFGIFSTQMYVQQMPRPEELNWNYIGQQSYHKLRYKIMNIAAILILLGLSYVLLAQSLFLVDKQSTSDNQISGIQKLWSSFIALLVVFLGIQFRKCMEVLAEYRKPNTKTSKTLFVVVTSTIFHLFYYVIIPLIYFQQYNSNKRSYKLFSISYQAFLFVIVQFLLSFFDVFHCFWDRYRTKIFMRKITGLCQKQVHKEVSAPRFPIEFKLIMMFKVWSFVLFYAFEMPYVLALIFLCFVYLYIKGKKNAYTHYRMQIIDPKVQYTFLKIYGNFFSIYLLIVYATTQDLQNYQFIPAFSITVVAIIFQMVYSVDQQRNINNFESIFSITVDQLQSKVRYQALYENYLKGISDPQIDNEIRMFVARNKGDLSSAARSLGPTVINKTTSIFAEDSCISKEPLIQQKQ